ncbi:Hypothetical protein R9X50_00166400 [Acrodontium crateriforme]|uniref:F-box domain-containing protein n=1 Tax=Acrodontium crateriforme TaxID=150365 RepID=A0AAQ3M0Y0_9PEZI|nr:Hypothetical protein R9X50_00166400 [Acrodontium crateriforme]
MTAGSSSSAASTPSTTLNATAKPVRKLNFAATSLSRSATPTSKMFRALQPAPLSSSDPDYKETPQPKCFYDLPAELRIEIYKLVLSNVTIHILPPKATRRHQVPHALTRTSKQVRAEVLPIVHSTCEIRANVTDFNFDGILDWINRIPPNQLVNLTKNQDLRIRLCTTLDMGNQTADSLRKWLHLRGDRHRPQPNWQYCGPEPEGKVANDLRRRAKRMADQKKRSELVAMIRGLGLRDPPC